METDLSRLHAVQLDLLRQVDRICRKHGIAYMLFAGTALGAVRHHGFIPWDDDLDIIMLRPAYEAFLRAAACELNSEIYTLQSEFTEHWPMFFSKLRRNNTTYLEKYYPKDPMTNLGVYIDIFPCDTLSDHPVMRKLQFAASKVVIAKSLDARGYLTDSRAKQAFIFVCRLLPGKLFHRLAVQRNHGKTRYVHTFFAAASSYEKSVFPRSWLEQVEQIPFEDGVFPVSAQYDMLLRTLYGDYMQLPPEEERACKVHALKVDLEHSYQEYAQWHREQKFDIFTRSIR